MPEPEPARSRSSLMPSKRRNEQASADKYAVATRCATSLPERTTISLSRCYASWTDHATTIPLHTFLLLVYACCLGTSMHAPTRTTPEARKLGITLDPVCSGAIHKLRYAASCTPPYCSYKPLEQKKGARSSARLEMEPAPYSPIYCEGLVHNACKQPRSLTAKASLLRRWH
ncbi:hypothetical protein BR93DRAFT_471251 [Coniochaeta sp. PMI_546]|nr:hypothetical protein BR93DRAFT_471251 [Coniochaeta sp. PMI_546]